MFSNNDKKTSTENDTNVGISTKIYGNIHFSGKLHIDGEITGNVVAEKDGSVLTISEGGRIEGNVQVHRIILNGEVKGDVYALNDIELAANARVKGNVFYDKIEMERGAEVNGSMIHGKPEVTENDSASVDALVENTTAATPESVVPVSMPVDNVVPATTSVENTSEPVQPINTPIQQPKIKIS